MNKRATVSKSEPPAAAGGIPSKSKRKPKEPTTTKPSREFIRSFRGKYKGSGLMEELMEEKKREREL